mmetsp:Transcript_51877/g.161432  ORF Transcript_51877/g.161432 Transcript_51877/m.161432 type:complete len:366 (+) Transcript_51877:49-1146(+)
MLGKPGIIPADAPLLLLILLLLALPVPPCEAFMARSLAGLSRFASQVLQRSSHFLHSRTRTVMSARDPRQDGMRGSLFQYAPQLQAFESGPGDAEKKLIMIGGLSDGLLPCWYVPSLGQAASEEGWSMVQPILRSSYNMWGFGSLERDVEDLSALLDFLAREREGKKFAICGHSTGCQIACHYMRSRENLPQHNISHIILQAGVSDRELEDADALAKQQENLQAARQLARQSGGGDEFLPRSACWAPVTAQRFLDLNDVGGKDDYFSSDLSEDELARRFGGFYSTTDVMIAYSSKDEYVPSTVNKQELVERIARAMRGEGGKARVVPLVVPNANHALSPLPEDPESASAEKFFVAQVREFLRDSK